MMVWGRINARYREYGIANKSDGKKQDVRRLLFAKEEKIVKDRLEVENDTIIKR